MIKNLKLLFLSSFSLIACNNNDEVATDYGSSDGKALTAGSANFSKYIALGNSLTSGFADNALFKAGQEYSYPSILSQQFALVGGGVFKIPYTNDNLGGLIFSGTVIQGTRIAFNGLNSSITAPNPNYIYVPNIGPIPGTPTTDITNMAVSAAGPYNNVGVPGAKSFHLLSPGYGLLSGVPPPGTANPYYARFMPQAAPKSMLDYVTAQVPTFFSLWIGNNDVLSYATSGGVGVNQLGNINSASYGPNDITDPVLFAGVYNALINGLTAVSPMGVVANIPDVTTIPYFTAVPTNPIPLTNTIQIGQLNGLFGGMNAMLVSAGKPARFQTLQLSVLDINTTTYSKTNALLISDEMISDETALYTTGFQAAPFSYPIATATFLASLYKFARHANASGMYKDYICLPARATIGTTQQGPIPPTNSTIGVTYPMPDNATITYNEAMLIKTATTAFNNTIKSLAAAKGLAFVDANAIMTQVANGGISANGYILTNAYATGGAFSYDGVHPTQRGYALIANKFLEAINATYGSNFKGVDLSKYKIAFPASL